jgi:hypothetical protein
LQACRGNINCCANASDLMTRVNPLICMLPRSMQRVQSALQ